mgnify:CR=1 FL=1
MACSLVFSQSRVDFLDAFDESESSVPGTISMLFSILSACLCAFLGRERVYDNEIGLFFLLFLSLFFILMFFVKMIKMKLKHSCERQTRSSSLFFSLSIKNRLETFIRKTQKKERKFNNDISNFRKGIIASQRKTFQL